MANNFKPQTNQTASGQSVDQNKTIQKKPDSSGKFSVQPKTETKQRKEEKMISFMATWFAQYYRFVTIGLCVVIIAIFCVLIVYPRISSARNLRGEVYDDLLDNQKRLEKHLDYLVKAQSERSSIPQKDIENIDDIIPNSPNTPQILTSLEDMATSSNIAIQGVDLVILDSDELKGKKENSLIMMPDEIGIVEINVSVDRSPYDDFKNFLDNVEKNKRLMDIAALVYAPNGKSYTVTIRSYYLQ